MICKNIYIYDILFFSYMYNWVSIKAVGLQTIVVIVKHDYVHFVVRFTNFGVQLYYLFEW